MLFRSNPAFTISYVGFKNSETASVIDTPPVASTTATATSNVGTYTISASGGLDNNYAFTYVPGTLDKDLIDNNLNGVIDERV